MNNAIFRVIKTQDYTVISNHHVRNKNLSWKAKGIMTYMLSCSDDWDYSIRGLTQFATDGRDSVRSAIKELENAGYVVRVKQSRTESGKFAKNIYYVYENPQLNNNHNCKNERNCDVSEDCVKIQNADLPLTDFPSTDNPSSENPTQRNTKIININKINTNISNLSNQDINNNIYNSKPYFDKKIDEIDYKNTMDKISKQINAHELYKNYSHEEVDELIDVIAGVYLTKAQAITIQGIMLDTEIVRTRLKCIEQEHIAYVLNSLRKTKSNIKNRKNYLLTALYNAPMSLHSTMQPSQDNNATSYDLDEFEEFALNFHPRI